MTDPVTDPGHVATVGELAYGLERATDSLDGVRAELRGKITTARRAAHIAIGTAVVAAVLAVAVAFLATFNYRQSQRINEVIGVRERDRVADAVAACQRSNDARQATVDTFSQFITVLAAAGQQPTTPEGQQALQQRVDKFRADFNNQIPEALRPRDCSGG